MDDATSDLEKQLLTRPFDRDLRLRYARRLLDDGDIEGAEAQFRILIEQDETRAAAYVGAATCRLSAGDHNAAIELYEQARDCDDFDSLEDLAELERTFAAIATDADEPDSPSLEIVEGGKPGEAGTGIVVPFSDASREQVHFTDIAGMEQLKQTLRMQIIEPFLRPEIFDRFKRKAGGGTLLYGPPGCGKTLMARAVSTECNASFIPVGISDVLSVWHGASESNIALLFDKARAQRPSVLFFDELDALAYSRSKASSDSSRTVVNEFLNQLDGFQASNESVLILAATNMPWDVDPAMKRPGRFARQIFVPPPDAAARSEMLRAKLTGIPQHGLDARALAERTQFFSGADMDGLIERAKDLVLEEIMKSGEEKPLAQEHLLRALEGMTPSTMDWLRTARNLVRYAGVDDSYRDVEKYLASVKLR
jgi:SpoVK/Ycf46/Vps4 family AAA+-type ATPase